MTVLNAASIRAQLVPTVVLGRHPGLGAPGGGGVDAEVLVSVLEGMRANDRFAQADAIFTGYFQSAAQVKAVVKAIGEAREINPGLKVMVDPILGDGTGDTEGRLYIEEATALAIRDLLLPLADVITPNRFELSWLSGRPVRTEAEAVQAARALGVTCLLTSAPGDPDRVGVMVIEAKDAFIATALRLAEVPNGTGDVFAAAALVGCVRKQDWRRAAGQSVVRVSHVLARTLSGGEADLRLDLDTLGGDLPLPVWRRVGARHPAWVMGLDGCKAGWAAVMVDLNGLRASQQTVFSTFQDALNWQDEGHQAQVLAVDMPIGFEETASGQGGRLCERLARQVLGTRRSSVFASPLRAALAGVDHDQAQILNRAAGGPGLSRQSFNLFPKLRELDALMTPELSDSVIFEAHPETCFAVISGRPARSKKSTPEGRAERLTLLREQGLEEHVFVPHPYKVSQCAPDDLVDAGLCALTAIRIAEGRAVCLPEDPPRDGKGLRMAIQA